MTLIIKLFLGLGLIASIYMAFIEPFSLRITHKAIHTSKWTNDKPINIAVLADIHAIWPFMTPSHLQKIVDKVNSLNPDIVVLMGDYVGDHPFGIQVKPAEIVAVLEGIKAPCGVYGVLGNHDMDEKDDWVPTLNNSSIPMLNNDAQFIDCNGTRFNVAGIEDWWYGKVDITKALSKTEPDYPIVFLTHNPDAFPSIPKNVAVTIAGHTHGGQIRFPFIGALAKVVPSRYGDKYAYGHIVENDKDMYVSSGIGMTGLPLRLLNKPEIALITLKN